MRSGCQESGTRRNSGLKWQSHWAICQGEHVEKCFKKYKRLAL